MSHLSDKQQRGIVPKDKDKILLIGDSLHSEVQGGINAGIDTCWYNREQNIASEDCIPTMEIHKLKELIKKL